MSEMREETRLGAYVLVRQDTQVLLVRKARGPYVGQWDLPGGKIEFGETPQDAARREVWEETGIFVAHLSLRDVFSHVVRWTTPNGDLETLHHIGCLFAASSAEGTVRHNGDKEDAASAGWHDAAAFHSDQLTPFARRALLGPAV